MSAPHVTQNLRRFALVIIRNLLHSVLAMMHEEIVQNSVHQLAGVVVGRGLKKIRYIVLCRVLLAGWRVESDKEIVQKSFIF